MESLPKFMILGLQSVGPVEDQTMLVGCSTNGACEFQLGSKSFRDHYGKRVTKFQLEPAAKTSSGAGDGDMIHIKSCYNNKYWVLKSQNDSVLAATAKEPNEDRSNWDCTLFRPVMDETKTTVYFMHVQLGHPVTYLVDDGYLHVSQEGHFWSMWFTDAERLVILPKQVAFKFVDNDTVKYLKAYNEKNTNYLQFTVIDPADPLVGNEISYNFDGSIRLWNKHYGRFWRASDKWIYADAKLADSRATWFWPVLVEGNVIALRSVSNGNFCSKWPDSSGEDCLSSCIPNITKEARLIVEEQVVSREIYNVVYHFSDSRSYDEKVLTVASGHVFNGSEVENDVELKFVYTETTTSTWKASVSLSLGMKNSIEVGVPGIGKDSEEFSMVLTGSYEWGKTRESSTQVETTYSVKVPAKTKMNVSLLASYGKREIPYSYTQRDTLLDGRVVVTQQDDGQYIGTGSYNFQYETDQVEDTGDSTKPIKMNQITTRPLPKQP